MPAQRRLHDVPQCCQFGSRHYWRAVSGPLIHLPRPDPGNNFFSQSPDLSIQNGEFAKVPIIIGDQEDEGTLFSLTLSSLNLTTTTWSTTSRPTFPVTPTPHSDVAGLMAQYPDQPLLGPTRRLALPHRSLKQHLPPIQAHRRRPRATLPSSSRAAPTSTSSPRRSRPGATSTPTSTACLSSALSTPPIS